MTNMDVPGQEEQETYVTWQEGAELLSVKRTLFYYFVQTGAIAERRTGPRDGRYKLADILKVKALREQGQGMHRPHKPHKKRWRPVVIDWIHPEDVPAGFKLDQIVYNEIFLAEAAVYQEWRRKNFKLSKAAFDAKDRNICLGYVGLIPLPESVILDILSGKREETSITPDEILTYDAPGGYTLLANSAAIHPDRPDLLYLLIKAHMQEWIDAYPERFIRRIYAQSVSAKGDIMIQHFFMMPRFDLMYNAYELDLARPAASKIVRSFKAALEEKAPLPDDLQWPPVQQVHVTAAPITEPESLERAEPITALPARQKAPIASTTRNKAILAQSEMPEGLIGWRSFAKAHGVAETTVAKAIKTGRLQIVEGRWKTGQTYTQGALDEAGRARFFELWPHAAASNAEQE